MTGVDRLRKDAQEQPERKEAEFWQGSDVYHGEIARAGAHRLAVSPNGKRYVLQTGGPQGWAVQRWRKALRLLLPDLPAELAALLPELPDDPERLPRPWAQEMVALSQRLHSVQLGGDSFAGVLWSAGELRLVRYRAQRGESYAVQTRGRDGWSIVTQARTAARLFDAVNQRYPEGHRLFGVGMDRGLRSAVLRLRARPEDMPGSAPRRPAEVRVSPKRPRRGGKGETATTGPHSAAQAQTGSGE